MGFFRNIIKSGLIETDDYKVRRGILLTNYISLFLTFAIISLFVHRFLVFGRVTHGVDWEVLIEGLIVFGSPIVFNRFHHTNISRFILCILPVIYIWYVFISRMIPMAVVETSYYDSLRIYLLALSPLPFLLFDNQKRSILLISNAPLVISFLFFEIILGWMGVSNIQKGIVSPDYQLMQVRTAIGYIVISGACYVFQSIIAQNDRLNQQMMAELKSNSTIIKKQNADLIQSQYQLNHLNQHLGNLVETKTADMKRQNEQIISLAFSISHKVRGSVARILGLIQISKLKTELDFPWFFEKVEGETKDLDEITKHITNDLAKLNIYPLDENEMGNQ